MFAYFIDCGTNLYISVDLPTALELLHHSFPVMCWYWSVFVDITSANILYIDASIATSSILYEVMYVGYIRLLEIVH